MQIIFKTIGLLAILAAFSSGCATRGEIVAFKTDAAYLRRSVDSLRVEQRRLYYAMLRVQKMSEENTEANARLRADIQLQIEQLAQQTQILSDRLEDTGQRIANLPSKLRFSVPAAVQPADSSRQRTVADSSAPASPGADDARQIYNLAYQDLVKGQYELSRQGFAHYLELLPSGDLADNAQYWIGESYYGQEKFDAATQAFQATISRYPGGDKVPAAMLKLAYSQLKLGLTTPGKENLRLLIQRFPSSNEANLARSRLHELK